MELTLEDLAHPPLPDGPLTDGWRGYLVAWSDGRRRAALAALTDFVDNLTGAPHDVSDGFAAWVCQLVFDHDSFWSGQWGGGMRYRAGAWQKPVAPALTAHLLSARVVLPYLIAALPEEHSPHLRWLYQFTVGQGYRLPPNERRRLFSAIEEHCGSGAPPIALLSRAPTDPIAQRLLHDAEHNASFGHLPDKLQ